MKLTAQNDLVVEGDAGIEQWIIGLYDQGGYNVCQVDMLAGPATAGEQQEDNRMAPAVIGHYHESMNTMEEQEICARLSGAIERAFVAHPEDLLHYHHVLEHEGSLSIDI